MSKSIVIKLPSHDFVTVDVPEAVEKSATVKEFVKLARRRELNGFSNGNFRFVFDQKELDGETLLNELPLVDGVVIEVIMKMKGDFFSEDAEYNSFLRAISPLHEEHYVAIDTNIVIEFGPSSSGSIVYTPALLDCDTLGSSFSGDMLAQLGQREATQRGFCNALTKSIFHQRIFLLELEPDVDVERVRYCWNGINEGYNQGDYHSWQRYTKQLPVECRVSDKRDYSTDISTVTMQPLAPLNYNTNYAILLANNVPIGRF